jgi:predicted amidohydrolase YtcJ
LGAVGFGRSTPRFFGGEVERDRSGEPNGVAWERAFSVLAARAERAEAEAATSGPAERFREAVRDRLAEGLTHLGEAIVPWPDLEALTASGGFDIGMTLMPVSERSAFSPPWDALDGPKTGEGDARLGIGHLKLFADGAERLAASVPPHRAALQTALVAARAIRNRDPVGFRVLRSSRARFDGSRLVTGTLHYPPSAMADLMEAALLKGFRIAVHALGNEGVRCALAGYEEARRRTGVDLAGCRIEHAMFAEPRDLERAASLGLVLSMQPGHAVHYAKGIRVAAADVVLDPVPLRRAVDAGCRVAISSDGPTAPGTALENMRAAVERIADDGRPIRPDLALSPIEALRAATIGGAEACGVADVKGALAPGKHADFAVLSGNQFDPSTRVLEAWVAGQRVHPTRA